MPDIQYIGENLLPRQVGHLAVILSFIAATIAIILYSTYSHITYNFTTSK